MIELPLATILSHVGLPDLKIDIRREWSSTRSSARQAIREAVSAELLAIGLREDASAVLDLTKIPRPKLARVSISHCPLAGGFALSRSAKALGLDLEDPLRVRDEVISRISAREEIERAPARKLLWVAKEAAFKALSGTENGLISQNFVTDWREFLQGELWNFKVNGDSQGVAILRPDIMLALVWK